MPIVDYRIVFDVINFNNLEEIGFQHFCLINIDKSNNVLRLVDSTKRNSAAINQIMYEREEQEYFQGKQQQSKALWRMQRAKNVHAWSQGQLPKVDTEKAPRYGNVYMKNKH